MDSPFSPSPGIRDKLTLERKTAFLRPLEELLGVFTPGERFILYGLTILLSASSLALLSGVNSAVSVTIPTRGGTLTEGLLGPARFINPLLTLSQADEDLTQLVYSGLTRTLSDGTVIPDLASSFEVSEDGTAYTFRLRLDATFHDGTPLTSGDVLFTVQQAQNPEIKSSHRADWEGVSVSTPDTHTVIFKLPRAYAPFLQNTSMGILPQHLWGSIDAEEFPFSPLNTHPIGTGAYKVSHVETDSSGSAVRYELVPFKNFALGRGHLERITFLFYPNQTAMIEAFNEGEIDAIAGLSPDKLPTLTRTDIQTITSPLPRIFAVFFNQSHATLFADASVRAALEAAIDKDRLVSMSLKGYGVPLDGPIPQGTLRLATTTRTHAAVSTAYTQETITKAKDILVRGDWKFDASDGTWSKGSQSLSFTLTTADAPELVATADAVATAWKQAGVKVAVQVHPLTELNTNVIRPRTYDALLFGEVIGRELDLFAFWHSSQRNDPGLNLSLYASAKVDTLLLQARATTKREERERLYKEFAETLIKDRPAVFLYAPEFVYVVREGLRGIELSALTTPGERFLNVNDWYTDTERVWSFFTNESAAQ